MSSQHVNINNISEWKEFINSETDKDGSLVVGLSLPEDVFPLFIIIEKDYICKEWTNLLSAHYCQLLMNHPRRCTRYHIFRDAGISSINDALGVEDENYHGYFTLYDSFPIMRGKTVIKPELFNIPLKCCKGSFNVHLLGKAFNVNCFPSFGQDGRYISCADASIWSLLRYFSEKYSEYREVYPSDIVQANKSLETGRNVPTRGLDGRQIINIIAHFGLTPEFEEKGKSLINTAKGYLESGIPIVLGSEEKQHAVVGIGLTGDSDFTTKGIKIGKSKHFHFNQSDRNIVCIDDNYMPYGLINENNRTDLKDSDLSSVFIPLYQKIFLDWGSAENVIGNILDDDIVGLKRALENNWVVDCENSLVIRLLLTSSKTYKKHLFENHQEIASSDLLRRIPFPKFIWIAECRNPGNPNPSNIKCEIGIDATASVHDETPYLFMRFQSALILSERWKSAGRMPEQKIVTLKKTENSRTPFKGNLR